jgi:hypothetical protein
MTQAKEATDTKDQLLALRQARFPSRVGKAS